MVSRQSAHRAGVDETNSGCAVLINRRERTVVVLSKSTALITTRVGDGSRSHENGDWNFGSGAKVRDATYLDYGPLWSPAAYPLLPQLAQVSRVDGFLEQSRAAW